MEPRRRLASLPSGRSRSQRSKSATALVIASIAVFGVGCFERSLRPVNPCTRSRAGDNIRVTSVDKVDLLFMVDNSNSMAEEQASLTEQLPRMVQVLASGDSTEPPDGVQDFQPVRSLHVGVITSDMGVGGATVPTCDSGTFGAALGDDGVLITRGRTSISGCMATYPSIFEFERDADPPTDPNTFANSVACVATTGTGGCGFEQQLEAVLKAVSPSAATDWTAPDYLAPRFINSSSGHAGPGGANDGFVRPDSALAIILVTDEEDCSAANPELFDPTSATFAGTDLNLRCFMYPTATHPIDRYVRGVPGESSGLIGLRQDPSLLIFAGIVGVPPATVMDPSNIDYAAILAHEDMTEVVDPTMPTRLRPSCNVPGRGVAFPPRRIVATAQGIQAAGGSATIQSICQESFAGALDEIISKIADALKGACLPRDLNPSADGFVECQVFEVLPTTGETTTCEGLPGRTFASNVIVNGVEREMCEVRQVGPAGALATPPEAGWWYEVATSADSEIGMTCGVDGQRIAFAGINPTTNADIRLECLQTIVPGGGGAISVGAFCVPPADPADPDACAAGSSGGVPLQCDAADRTCAVFCTTNADCTAAGLLGDVCDTRSWLEAVAADEPGISAEEAARRMASIPGDPGAPHNFCVNPTCI